MTREEAIEELKEDITLYMPIEQGEEINRDTPDGRLITALEMAIKALEQMWIPVSERLPEDKTYVLVTIAVRGRQPHSRSSWYQTGAFHNDNGDYWRADEPEVVAWMPLPEPYKAESNLDGDPVDIDKAVEHYEKTLETLKGIDLEVDG